MEALLTDIQEDIRKLNRKFEALLEAFKAQRDVSQNPQQNTAPPPALAAGEDAEVHSASQEGQFSRNLHEGDADQGCGS